MRNRFVGEGGRPISDTLEISESLNLKGYIVTVDTEKTFDSLSHSFFTCLLVSVLLLSSGNTPTSQKYFGKGFPNETFDWKKIYILLRVVTIKRFQCNFQYKILHNILDLNRMLFSFGKTKTLLYSFCHSYDETIKHIFLECIYGKQLWNHLRLFLTNDISLPILRIIKLKITYF